MAVIHVGITRDDAKVVTKLLEPGKGKGKNGMYRMLFKGFFRKDKNNPESIIQKTKSGGLMITALFQPADPEILNRSNIMYNAPFSPPSKFYADLIEALPNLYSGDEDLDDNLAINSEVWAQITSDEVIREGVKTGQFRNGIGLLVNINAV